MPAVDQKYFSKIRQAAATERELDYDTEYLYEDEEYYDDKCEPEPEPEVPKVVRKKADGTTRKGAARAVMIDKLDGEITCKANRCSMMLSPVLPVFCKNFLLHLTIDNGAEVNIIRHSVAVAMGAHRPDPNAS